MYRSLCTAQTAAQQHSASHLCQRESSGGPAGPLECCPAQVGWQRPSVEVRSEPTFEVRVISVGLSQSYKIKKRKTLPFAVSSDVSACVPENSQSADSAQALVSLSVSDPVQQHRLSMSKW